jgi:uncharacterized OB-fold protein
MSTALPERTPETAGFWQALDEGRLVARRCTACGRLHPTPRRFCPSCGSEAGAWEERPDAASIFSVTVLQYPPGDRPYLPKPTVLAIVAFADDHRMLALIDTAQPQAAAIGDALSFRPWRREGIVLPAFVRRAEEGGEKA